MILGDMDEQIMIVILVIFTCHSFADLDEQIMIVVFDRNQNLVIRSCWLKVYYSYL